MVRMRCGGGMASKPLRRRGVVTAPTLTVAAVAVAMAVILVLHLSRPSMKPSGRGERHTGRGDAVRSPTWPSGPAAKSAPALSVENWYLRCSGRTLMISGTEATGDERTHQSTMVASLVGDDPRGGGVC